MSVVPEMNELPIITVPASLAVPGINATPHIIKKLDELAESGGTLLFETGEYHFYTDGTRGGFFAPSNNASGRKSVCFPLLDIQNLCIDGGGSVFVFHGSTFPFIVSESTNVALQNFTCDTALSSVAALEITEKTEEGFFCRIDKSQTPFHTESGHLIFEREGQTLTTEDGRLSLHSLDRMAIFYLFAGDTTQSKENLATSFIDSDAFELSDKLYFRYRENTQITCPFEVGERVVINLEEKRERSVFFFENSERITVENVTIRRGGGMGLVAQMCKDVRVRGMKTDRTFHGNTVTLTADAFHLIHCSGDFELSECDMGSFLDDACNIHGVYTVFDRVNGDCLHLHLGHVEQNYFCPYKAGDVLAIRDKDTLKTVCEARVRDVYFSSNDGMSLSVKVEFLYGADALCPGFLVENPARMPRVSIHHNRFYDFPHIRLSGAGEMHFEHNEISDCDGALLLMDLANFWYESGRIREAHIRHNRFIDCNAKGSDVFIQIGVSGFEPANAPRVHELIEIAHNRFEGLKRFAVCAGGVQTLALSDNTDGKDLLPDSAFLCV